MSTLDTLFSDSSSGLPLAFSPRPSTFLWSRTAWGWWVSAEAQSVVIRGRPVPVISDDMSSPGTELGSPTKYLLRPRRKYTPFYLDIRFIADNYRIMVLGRTAGSQSTFRELTSAEVFCGRSGTIWLSARKSWADSQLFRIIHLQSLFSFWWSRYDKLCLLAPISSIGLDRIFYYTHINIVVTILNCFSCANLTVPSSTRNIDGSLEKLACSFPKMSKGPLESRRRA